MSGSWSGAARAANATLVRRGAVALVVTALLVVAGAAVVGGRPSALGAVLGIGLVVLFFGVDLAVFLRPGRSAPVTATVVVMLYVAKLVAFGFLVLGLQALLAFDHTSFAVAVIVEAAAAAAVAVLVFARMRVLYVAP